MLTQKYLDTHDGVYVLPELEGNRVREIMRIRVTKVFSPLRYTFGESISLIKKSNDQQREVRRWGCGRKKWEEWVVQ